VIDPGSVMPSLALFDFDGTISDRDSFLLFMRSTHGWRFYRTCLSLSPLIGLFLAGRYPNERLKSAFLKRLFRGDAQEEVVRLAQDYCSRVVPGIIRPAALETLARHRQDGSVLAVVTATPRIILEPWCLEQGVAIIGTELEVDDQRRLTGRLQGANCRGEEKVRRILARYRLADFSRVYAYGDTRGDLPMLDLAAPPDRFYKPFRQ